MSGGPHYARGEKAWGICGRCGQRALLHDLVFDGYYPNLRVHERCYEARHPQDRLGTVIDPVALWRPSPEDYPITPPVLTLALGSVVLTWTAAVSYHVRIETYTVYRAIEDGDAVQIAQYTNSYSYDGALESQTLTHTDEDADDTGVTYRYYVVASASDTRFSANSNTASITIPALEAPSAPVLSGERNSGDDTQVDLSWTAATAGTYSIQDYVLQRSLNGAGFVQLAVIDAADPRVYTDTGLQATDEIEYRVFARDVEANAGANSNTVTIAAAGALVVYRIGSTPETIATLEGGSPLSASITPADDGNEFRRIVVEVIWVTATGGGNLTSATFGGRSMTVINGANFTAPNDGISILTLLLDGTEADDTLEISHSDLGASLRLRMFTFGNAGPLLQFQYEEGGDLFDGAVNQNSSFSEINSIELPLDMDLTGHDGAMAFISAGMFPQTTNHGSDVFELNASFTGYTYTETSFPTVNAEVLQATGGPYGIGRSVYKQISDSNDGLVAWDMDVEGPPTSSVARVGIIGIRILSASES